MIYLSVQAASQIDTQLILETEKEPPYKFVGVN